ncbi:hypothetical protein H7J06_05905 [Mycobacterium hodleri]|uniref:hypothetical protein n=1 Tax=Mycolicibacterium hodleri TaxID=49897 RepID=UPI000A88813B|nr:hypothetical protein [Mycolicibacterium hodleri]MCV7132515.1 hypothetical protein [Mycolicibacterium hodleri]
MTATDQVLRIELEFSREQTEAPSFVAVATRAFTRELGLYVDVPTDERDIVREKEIAILWLRDKITELEAELADRERAINASFIESLG